VSAKVRFRPAALADLDGIYRWIAERADGQTAYHYLLRVQEACRGLADFPNRGADRSELEPGLRSMAFERSALILYRMQQGDVQIVRVLRRGRDIEAAINDG
jgi:toxin ParE1/3/4